MSRAGLTGCGCCPGRGGLPDWLGNETVTVAVQWWVGRSARHGDWDSNDGAIGSAFDGFLECRAFLLASPDAALPDGGAGARRPFRPDLRRAALALDPRLHPLRGGGAAGGLAWRSLERRGHDGALFHRHRRRCRADGLRERT